MKVAIATEKDVACPDCKKQFEVSPDLYGAEVQCPECSCEFKVQAPPAMPRMKPVRPVISPGSAPAVDESSRTASGIEVEEGGPRRMAPMSTVKLTRNKSIMEQLKKNLPAPVSKEVSKLAEVEPLDNQVSCPKCGSSFAVVPEFFGAIGECPDCASEFVIKRPSGAALSQTNRFQSIRVRSTEPAEKPASAASGPSPKPGPGPGGATPIGRRRNEPAAPPPGMTSSGIEIAEHDDLAPKQHHATATVRLSRSMSMAQHEKGAPPAKPEPPPEMAPPPPPEHVATLREVAPLDNVVACPGCGDKFAITPEYYGAVAECPECAAEFLIKPPKPAAPVAPAIRRPSVTAKPSPPAEAAPAKPAVAPPPAAPAPPVAKAEAPAEPKSEPEAAPEPPKPAKPKVGRKPQAPPPTPATEETPAAEAAPEAAAGSSKTKLYVVIGVVALVVIGGAVWYFFLR